MKPLDEAKKFVLSNVITPALESDLIEKEIKDKIHKTSLWVESCREVGNIFNYIKRYSGVNNSKYKKTYLALKENNLTPVEDIIEPFKKQFSNYLDNVFTWKDLIVGEIYTSWDLSHLSQTYNVQRGIYLVGGDKPETILSKVTMNQGKYPNEWLDQERVLKHYMYSHNEKYDINYKVNAAVIASKKNNISIQIFNKINQDCIYLGEFDFKEWNGDEFSKWFILERRIKDYISLQKQLEKLEIDVKRSNKLSSVDRSIEIKKYPTKPKKRMALARIFDRNPHVVVETLRRANGICERCKKDAPFIRASDSSPYLEVHHIVTLADGADDTLSNTLALCPNCHKELHFGKK